MTELGIDYDLQKNVKFKLCPTNSKSKGFMNPRTQKVTQQDFLRFLSKAEIFFKPFVISKLSLADFLR